MHLDEKPSCFPLCFMFASLNSIYPSNFLLLIYYLFFWISFKFFSCLRQLLRAWEWVLLFTVYGHRCKERRGRRFHGHLFPIFSTSFLCVINFILETSDLLLICFLCFLSLIFLSLDITFIKSSGRTGVCSWRLTYAAAFWTPDADTTFVRFIQLYTPWDPYFICSIIFLYHFIWETKGKADRMLSKNVIIPIVLHFSVHIFLITLFTSLCLPTARAHVIQSSPMCNSPSRLGPDRQKPLFAAVLVQPSMSTGMLQGSTSLGCIAIRRPSLIFPWV